MGLVRVKSGKPVRSLSRVGEVDALCVLVQGKMSERNSYFRNI